jgi:hypothetical protein
VCILFLFFFLAFLGGVRLSPLGTSATVDLLYQPRMINDDDYGADWQGKPKYSEKTCPSATLSGRIAGVPVWIRTEYLPNTNLDCYGYDILLGRSHSNHCVLYNRFSVSITLYSSAKIPKRIHYDLRQKHSSH